MYVCVVYAVYSVLTMCVCVCVVYAVYSVLTMCVCMCCVCCVQCVDHVCVCPGVLHDAYDVQCCGGRVISDSLMCCGNASIGKSYQPHADKYCCGVVYVSLVNTVCCSDVVGNVKVIIYVFVRYEKFQCKI